MTIDISFLAELENIVRSRMGSSSEESYTARLLQAGTKRIAQKVGEEGVELALAATAGDRNEVVDEAADLMYHVVVLLAQQELSLQDVCARLQSRHSAT